jgi:hypothetical protein
MGINFTTYLYINDTLFFDLFFTQFYAWSILRNLFSIFMNEMETRMNEVNEGKRHSVVKNTSVLSLVLGGTTFKKN